MQIAVIKSQAETKLKSQPVQTTTAKYQLKVGKEKLFENPNQILCYFYVEKRDRETGEIYAGTHTHTIFIYSWATQTLVRQSYPEM